MSLSFLPRRVIPVVATSEGGSTWTHNLATALNNNREASFSSPPSPAALRAFQRIHHAHHFHMDSPSLATLERLSLGQKATLKRGLSRACAPGGRGLTASAVNILTVADIILLSPSDLVKKCRISHHEAQEIINTVCDELAPKLYTFYHEDLPKDETFTTGDALVDRVLGGGIRVGKLWEVVGER